MDLSPQYLEPVNRYDSKIDVELYRESAKQFEQQKYEESFRTFMCYVNREMAEKYEIEKNHWRLPHGSLVVDIVIKDGALEVSAPFVKLPPERLAPILRRVFDINTNVLTLPLVKLEGDGLFFRYACPLALAEPFKIYGVINEICINGDSYDDEFVEKFGAVPLREKEVTYLPAEQVERAWQTFHSLLDEGMRYDEYFSMKRWTGYCIEILGQALMKIDYVLAPQGYLRTRLENAISQLWARRPAEEVASGLRRDIGELKKLEKDDFAKDFYKTTFFMHAKRTAEIAACQKSMEGRFEWAKQDRQNKSAIGVVMCYEYASYDLFYKFFVPPKLERELHDTLAACNVKSWPEAAELCWTNFQKIMDPSFA